MSDGWKESWVDTKTNEKVYWCFTRKRTEEELKEMKQMYEEENTTREDEDKFIDFDSWAENQEFECYHLLCTPKTEEEWKKSVLCIEQDGGAEGVMCFYNNQFDFPVIEDGDDDFSDYTKLRILNLVMWGYVPEETVNLMFRNYLTNYYTDNGKITDEQFKELNKL